MGAVLSSIAHMRPVTGTNQKKTKAKMAELHPRAVMYLMAAQTTAVSCAASF